MDINIIKFVVEGVIALGLASTFLILGLLFLPDSWILLAVNTIKPKIVDGIKAPFRTLINALANLYINNSLIDLFQDDSEFNDKTQVLLKQNHKIEKNIYAIDLCKDMIATLRFVAPHVVGSGNYDLQGQTMEYLYHYSRIIENIEQDPEFVENFLNKIEGLKDTFNEASEQGCTSTASKNAVEQNVNDALGYLSEERRKLDKFIEENKKTLVKLLRARANVL